MSERLIGSVISIHALLTESDRGANHATQHLYISIHALLTESDTKPIDQHQAYLHFYPRSPYGERLKSSWSSILWNPFLSTLSLRRATWLELFLYYQDNNFYPRSPYGERPWQRGSRITYVEISIHALLTESDCPSMTVLHCKTLFLSTLSLRRATPDEKRTSILY